MTFIQTPRRHTNQKPRLGDRIDWTHPLARGLIFCANLIEGNGPPQDIVQGKLGTVTGATWSGGDLLFTNGTTNNVDWGKSVVYQPAIITATVEFVVTGNNTSSTLFDTRQSGGGWTIFLPSGTSIETYVSNGITNGNISQGLSLNTRYVASLVYDGSTLSNYLTSNGLTTVVSVSSNNLVYDALSSLRLGDDSSNRCFGGIIKRATLHSRALLTEEVKRLHAEPNAFIMPQNISRYTSIPYTTPTPRRRMWISMI